MTFKKGNKYWKLSKHDNSSVKNPMFGKKHSKETKDKIRKANKGKRYSIETEFKKNQKPWNFGKLGYLKGRKKNF